MNDLKVCYGEIKDITVCAKLFDSAREYFKNNGIDQWQDIPTYPNEDSVKNDISDDAWFVVKEMLTDKIVACFMTKVCIDPTYETPLVTGSWLTNATQYGVVHRVAVNNAYKGKGVGNVIMQFAQQHVKGKGALSLKCDTHEQNKSMHNLLIKNGFKVCGNMVLPSGAPRIAYEKVF